MLLDETSDEAAHHVVFELKNGKHVRLPSSTLSISVVPPVVGGAPYLVFAIAGPLGLVLPYFIRDVLVDRDAPKVVLRWAGPAIVISLGVLREQIKGATPVLQAGVLFLVAVYISSYFWLMSDSRIVVVKE